jgi:apolipoprotein N-acyltransferase
MPVSARRRRNNYGRAILAMVAAVGLFSFMDAGMKWLAPHYPPMQVAALRGMASAPLVFLWAIVTAAPVSLVRIRWSMHLLRGALSIFMLATFAYALKRPADGGCVHAVLHRAAADHGAVGTVARRAGRCDALDRDRRRPGRRRRRDAPDWRGAG